MKVDVLYKYYGAVFQWHCHTHEQFAGHYDDELFIKYYSDLYERAGNLIKKNCENGDVTEEDFKALWLRIERRFILRGPIL